MKDKEARYRLEKLEEGIGKLDVKLCSKCKHATVWQHQIFEHWYCLNCGTHWRWQSPNSYWEEVKDDQKEHDKVVREIFDEIESRLFQYPAWKTSTTMARYDWQTLREKYLRGKT